MSKIVKTNPWISWKETIQCFTESDLDASHTVIDAGNTRPTGEPVTCDHNIEWLVDTHEGNDVCFLRADFYRTHPDHDFSTGNLTPGTETVNRWWGLNSGYEPDDLEPVPEKFCIQDGKEYLLRHTVMQHLINMIEAAAKEDIIIKVISAYRSFDYQVGLYDTACRKDGVAQRYSAPPGHSEHQLGTCVDLCDPEEMFSFTEAFGGTDQGLWLERHSKKFGFLRSYTQENKAQTGYISEPWHWRYVGSKNLE